MNTLPKRPHIFQGYGIELEYMIVDKETLNVKPLADRLIEKVLGQVSNDVIRGDVTWSNELVVHLIELKCSSPTNDLVGLNQAFAQNIDDINNLLKEFNARLLPGAAHPWMDPAQETHLWKYDQHDIYDLYDKIFNCQGHGWSNLQSTHINLPFYDDEEFARLHAAVRLVLPLIPALAAGSPILDSKTNGTLDKRLVFYRDNQKRIPSIGGKLIPERVYSQHAYRKQIYEPIKKALIPFDPDNILDPIWVNSRGAIARFDRGSIEIRVMDIQECPQADLAIIAMIIYTLRLLVDGKLSDLNQQQNMETDRLKAIFDTLVVDGENGNIVDTHYLKLFDIEANNIRARTFWLYLYHLVIEHYPEQMKPWKDTVKYILDQGTLSTRILNSVNGDFSRENLHRVYKKLGDCLSTNKVFEPWVQEVL